jgi:hypothetical protein
LSHFYLALVMVCGCPSKKPKSAKFIEDDSKDKHLGNISNPSQTPSKDLAISSKEEEADLSGNTNKDNTNKSNKLEQAMAESSPQASGATRDKAQTSEKAPTLGKRIRRGGNKVLQAKESLLAGKHRTGMLVS